MASDGGLWDCIKSGMKDVHWVRVETWQTVAGVPDLNGCLNGVEVWIENKFTDAWAVKIRPHQIGFMEKRRRHGGRTFLMIRRRHSGGPQKGPAVDELWLFNGNDARSVSEYGLDKCKPPLLMCSGGPAKWNWKEVRRLVFE